MEVIVGAPILFVKFDPRSEKVDMFLDIIRNELDH